MALWLLLAAMGIVTFALRLSFIGLAGRLRLPSLLWRALRFVPPAVFCAIIFPDVLRPAGAVDLSWRNPRLVAAGIAAVAAWRTRSVLLTIVAGMAALWGMRAIAP